MNWLSHVATWGVQRINSSAPRLNSVLVAGLAALALSAGVAMAQTWPAKPIRVISTFGPGSVAEINMRLVLARASESIGQPFVMDARAGAGGIVGADLVMRAAPDGYTILYANSSTLITAPLLMVKKPFEAKDFTPIMLVYEGITCFTVNASLPMNTMKELLDHIARYPGKLAYGHNGIGGNYHLTMELIKQQLGLDITGIPYKGGTAALLDTVTGTIPMSFTATATADPFVKSGKIKMLAVIDNKRHPDYPNVPALAEAVPNFEKLPTALSLFGPAGLPPAIVTRLHGELTKALHVPEIRSKNRDAGFYAVERSPADFAAQLKRDVELSQRAIKAAGLKPE
ncbi:MAG: Bug family tripartite tricarboxylate transporter substrate binding protein [Burkholderiales bacterium]